MMPNWVVPVVVVAAVVSFQFTIVLLAVLNKGNPAVMQKLLDIEEQLANVVSGNITKPKQ